jgi:iron complex outermembrane receptor protein
MNAQNSTRARVFRRSLLAVACAAAATPVFAQSAAAPASAASAADLQRVEITGSRIKQIDAEGASPVQVIRREDIKKTGATSVAEMLNQLTITSTNGATISDINGSGTFSPGASQANLRNLGAQSTLVLLNGRRLPTFPLPNFQETFTNIDTIPLDAVDRIEVLKVGGSAIYGSDAIAGVINIITRSSFEGLQVSGSDQTSLKNHKFGERTEGITGGLGNYDKDGYNVFGSVEFFQRQSVIWDGAVLRDVNPKYGDVSPSFGTPSTFSYPGNLDFQAIAPGCTGPLRDGECLYDRYSRFQAVPAAQRVNAILGGDLRISDKMQWHNELQLSSTRVTYISANPAYGNDEPPTTWLDAATGQLNAPFYERGLPVTNPLNTTGEDENTNDFRYRFDDANSGQQTNSTSYRLLSGLKGSVNDWDYDTAIGVMGGFTKDRSRGQFSVSGFNQEIGNPGQFDPNTGQLTPVPADFFNVPGGYKIGGGNTAAVLNTLFPQYGFDGTYRQYFADGNVTNTIAQLPAGPLQLSLGGEIRHESMVLSPTANLLANDIVGFAQSQSDGERTFEAVYGELQVPIIDKLQANLAARVDKFPHIGAHLSPRASLEYTPVDLVKFRGTVETGFRAPNLQESSPSTKSAFQPGVIDPVRCPAATTIANQYRAQAATDPDPNDAANLIALAEQIQSQECSESVNEIAVNNPNLKPERSLSESLGAVFQLTKHWSATIDWWSILRKNEINLKSVQDLLNSGDTTAVTRAAFDPTGATDPTFTGAQLAQYGITQGPIASVRLQYGNLFETRTSGVDFGVTGDVDTPIGKLTSGVEGTYTANWQTYSPTRNGTGGWGDNLAGRYGYPHWQMNFTESLATGSFTNTIRWAHQSGTTLQGDFNDPSYTQADCPGEGLTAAQCKMSAYNRMDYALEYTGVKNLTVGGNIINVLGHRPPVDYRGFGGASGIIPVSNEDAQGRLLKVYFSYKFL